MSHEDPGSLCPNACRVKIWIKSKIIAWKTRKGEKVKRAEEAQKDTCDLKVETGVSRKESEIGKEGEEAVL